ncbi:MAG: YidC/Oxa1 family membrane protein insertase, partial [Clostridia bacterium]
MIAWFNGFLRDIINMIYQLVQSHGWSIVLFTLLIRVVLFPLDFKSRKSMRRMTALQPKINALNLKYAKDKEKLNQKTSELYRKEKINPLAGCLPMLLSMPILFAMFAVMRNVANEELARMLLGLYEAVGQLTDPEAVKAALSGMQLNMESWLWVKNLWMADSPFQTILPTTANDLMTLQAVQGLITADQIQALKTFVETDLYKQVVLPYFNALPLAGGTVNMLFFQLTVFAKPNGYFLLPVLAAVTQYLTTILTPQSGAPADPSKPNTTGNFMK